MNQRVLHLRHRLNRLKLSRTKRMTGQEMSLQGYLHGKGYTAGVTGMKIGDHKDEFNGVSAVQGNPRASRENSCHQLVIGDAVAVSGNADGEVDKGEASGRIQSTCGCKGVGLQKGENRERKRESE